METALSHYRNLYFVAVGPEIHVYQPQFPSQQLASDHVFKLCPPVTATSLPGYINPESPHAVNHLVVGDLGNEEILVSAHDNGDVVAYTTRSIGFAIEKFEPGRWLPLPHRAMNERHCWDESEPLVGRQTTAILKTTRPTNVQYIQGGCILPFLHNMSITTPCIERR